MNKQKPIDCIEMKRQAQDKIRQKYAGMPEQEAHRLQREAALADPILGPFLVSLRSHRPARQRA
jgi:hypothetical protein